MNTANKKKFTGAIQRNRFEPICSHLTGMAHEKGKVAAAYKEETNELLIKYFDPELDSLKYVLSNAFIKTKRPKQTSRRKSRSLIPVYSEYAVTFDLCDRFNRNLHERTWSHKSGGTYKKGEPRNYHNFASTSVLQNIFNLYHSISCENNTEESFCDFFCRLADKIAQLAQTIS